METINEIRESLFLRKNYTPASGHLFFLFFLGFSKKQVIFSYTYFSISFIRLVQTDFLLSEKSFSFSRSYFAASRNHY